MSVKVNIVYPHLTQYTDDQEIVDVSGNTVGECMEELVKRYPGIRSALFDSNGHLLNYISFWVNKESVHETGLSTTVKDGDEITIALLIAGG